MIVAAWGGGGTGYEGLLGEYEMTFAVGTPKGAIFLTTCLEGLTLNLKPIIGLSWPIPREAAT